MKRKRRKTIRAIPAVEAMRLAAHMRHGFLWAMCGCNPLTLPLHIWAVESFYGPRRSLAEDQRE